MRTLTTSQSPAELATVAVDDTQSNPSAPLLRYDTHAIKRDVAPVGWPYAINRVTGIGYEFLDPSCHGPCPKCGGDDRWRFTDSDGENDGVGGAICNSCGKFGDGIAVIQWYCGVRFTEALRMICECLGTELSTYRINGTSTLHSHPKTTKRRAPKPRLPESAAELRHRVYSRFAELCGLLDHHREQLRERGLTDAEIDRRGYFSASNSAAVAITLFTEFRELHEQIAREVPGIFPGKAVNVNVFKSGLMIPVRDQSGQMIAIRFRPDNAGDGNKYQCFTSQFKGKNKVGEFYPTPGTPCHFSSTPAASEAKTIRLTEGDLKADIASQMTSIPTISVSGVGTWQNAIETIESSGYDRLLLSFDADAATNEAVAKVLREAWGYFTRPESTITPEIETWPATMDDAGKLQPKGIDDALVAGATIRTLAGDEARAFIASLQIAPKNPTSSVARKSPFSNFVIEVTEEKNSKGETVETRTKCGLPISVIAKKLLSQTGGWPKFANDQLFIVQDERVERFAKSSNLFSWINDASMCTWGRGESMPTKEEFFDGLSRHCERYEAIEAYPHFPQMADHYYVSPVSPSKGTDVLDEFLAFFKPAKGNAGLLRAALLTLFWGGSPGSRPLFLITSDHGTGSGKSKVAELFASLVGTPHNFGTKTDGDKIRTDLLTPGMETARTVIIDNVKAKLSSEAIESLVTSSTIGGHKNYHGSASRPNTMIWFITANAATLSRDLAQRSIVVKVDKPDYDGQWLSNVRNFIKLNRERIYADVAYVFSQAAAGISPASRWAEWETDVLARCNDPASLQTVIGKQGGECDADGDRAAEIESVFFENLKLAGYKPEKHVVHVPNNLAANWLAIAFDEHVGKSSVSRTINLLHRSGSLPRISINPSKNCGRGFIWRGDDSDPKESVNYELESIISGEAKHEQDANQ